MNIGFIGLGKLGLPCAEVFATKYNTFGYDIIKKKSRSITICLSIQKLVESTQIIFIAIQTPHSKEYGGEFPSTHLPLKNFSYLKLESCLKEVNKFVNQTHTVVIISTVLPGTVRSRLKPILTNCTLLYNPYLIAMGTVKDDFCKPEMVIIGSKEKNSDDKKVKLLINIYNSLMHSNTRFEIGTWEEAESIKIFYNTFISAKIAIVNMIQDVAERIDYMDVDMVTNALSKSNLRITSSAYMKAGMGDGGPCHPRDNIALSWFAHHLGLNYDLFKAISFSREMQAKNLAIKLVSYNLPIVILGCSYKPNVDLTDGSYSLLVAFYIQQLGKTYFLDKHPDTKNPYTYLIAHENIFENYPFNKNSIIVDVWRTFKTNRSDLKIYYYGTYKNL